MLVYFYSRINGKEKRYLDTRSLKATQGDLVSQIYNLLTLSFNK